MFDFDVFEDGLIFFLLPLLEKEISISGEQVADNKIRETPSNLLSNPWKVAETRKFPNRFRRKPLKFSNRPFSLPPKQTTRGGKRGETRYRPVQQVAACHTWKMINGEFLFHASQRRRTLHRRMHLFVYLFIYATN